MNRWFENLGYKINQFMRGRYGYDELFRFLTATGLLLMLLSFLPHLYFLYVFGAALMILACARSLSKNILKRQMKRSNYLNFKNRILQKLRLARSRWRDRKIYRYYKCPNCKVTVRISNPGKRRRIEIACPKCGAKFEKRT